MPRTDKQRKQAGPLHQTVSALRRLFRRSEDSGDEVAVQQTAPRARRTVEHATAKPARRETDIPFDLLDRAYTPPATSSKASFRSDGADHHTDQELAFGVADERWNAEDRYTNKSGDPRIGTHRRTYEPDESRAESNK